MGKYPVLVVIGLGLAGLLAGCGDSSSSSSGTGGGEKPVFTTAEGEPLEWDDLRGNWVLVNYWAEWCKPCLEEIPELNKVDAIEGVTVLAVNYDGITGDELLDLGDRMGISFTMLAANPAPDLGWDVPDALPATFLVAPDGTLEDTLMGAQTEADLMTRIGRD